MVKNRVTLSLVVGFSLLAMPMAKAVDYKKTTGLGFLAAGAAFLIYSTYLSFTKPKPYEPNARTLEALREVSQKRGEDYQKTFDTHCRAENKICQGKRQHDANEKFGIAGLLGIVGTGLLLYSGQQK